MVAMKSDVPINLKKMGVKCKLSRITFQLPADQVPDWDDRMRTVKWVDVLRNPPGTLTTKRKVSEDIRRGSDQACHGWGAAALHFSVSSLPSFTNQKKKKKKFPILLDLDFRSDKLNLQACQPTHLDLSGFSFSLDASCSKVSHLLQRHRG